MCASKWVSPRLMTYALPGPCFLCASRVTLYEEDSDRSSTPLDLPHLSRWLAVAADGVFCALT